MDTEERKIGLSLRTEGPLEGEDEQPRIVVRSDELEKSENPQALITEVMEEARVHERERAEAGAARREAPRGATSSLNIPTDLIKAEAPAAPAEAEAETPSDEDSAMFDTAILQEGEAEDEDKEDK